MFVINLLKVTMLYPVILSGGSGTRLWPLSRVALPKQFLPLISEHTLFQETLLRLKDFPSIAAPLVICNNEHRFLVAEQLRAVNINPLMQVLEPLGRNTAPATCAYCGRGCRARAAPVSSVGSTPLMRSAGLARRTLSIVRSSSPIPMSG